VQQLWADKAGGRVTSATRHRQRSRIKGNGENEKRDGMGWDVTGKATSQPTLPALVVRFKIQL